MWNSLVQEVCKMAVRLETNFNRLLHRCETMAGENREGDWRLEKYVGALQEQLNELRKSPGKPSQEVLAEYSRKVEFMKGLIDTEKLSSASEKALAIELLTPALHTAENALPSREVHLQTKARYQREMREELLGTDHTGSENVRHRKGAAAGSTEEDLDAVLKHHHGMQEKLAEEMVHLARNLKETARAAGKVVQQDNKTLSKSTQLADSNMSRLKVESERLDKHVQKSCNWWIWIMLIVVCITFVWMVLFMRMFTKR